MTTKLNEFPAVICRQIRHTAALAGLAFPLSKKASPIPRGGRACRLLPAAVTYPARIVSRAMAMFAETPLMYAIVSRAHIAVMDAISARLSAIARRGRAEDGGKIVGGIYRALPILRTGLWREIW
jgi:hypothetical protein